MGLTLNQKQEIRDKVAQGQIQVSQPLPRSVTSGAAQESVVGAAVAALHESVRTPASPAVGHQEELVIEITGDNGTGTITLRPSEVSRLRGRFGRGPGFEQWVAARIRDLMVSFGGG